MVSQILNWSGIHKVKKWVNKPACAVKKWAHTCTGRLSILCTCSTVFTQLLEAAKHNLGPVIKNTNTLLDHIMKHHWMNAYPSHPRSLYWKSHRQSWKSSASCPAHSQSSVYTIALTSYTSVCNNLHLYICTHIHSYFGVKQKTWKLGDLETLRLTWKKTD